MATMIIDTSFDQEYLSCFVRHNMHGQIQQQVDLLGLLAAHTTLAHSSWLTVTLIANEQGGCGIAYA